MKPLVITADFVLILCGAFMLGHGHWVAAVALFGLGGILEWKRNTTAARQ